MTSSCFLATGRSAHSRSVRWVMVARLDVVPDVVELGEAGRVRPPPVQRARATAREAAVGGDDFPLDVLREPRERPRATAVLRPAAGPGAGASGASFALAPNFLGRRAGAGGVRGVKKHRSAGGGGLWVALTRPAMFGGL